MSNIKFFSFIILSLTLFLAVDCEGPEVCTREYRFDFPISLTPVLDTVQIGDSIWINMEYDNSNVFDMNSSENLDAGEFEFNFEMLLSKFDTTSIVDGLDFFNYTAIEGAIDRQFLVGISSLNLTFQKTEASRNFSAFFIPQTTGNFSIVFTSILNHEEINFLDESCKESMKLSFTLNNGENNNFEFYQLNSNDSAVTSEGFLSSGGFAFSVVE